MKLDVVSATDVARQAEEAAPNNPLVLGTLAEVFGYQADKAKDAMTYSKRFMALDPLNPDAYTFLANALMFQGRTDEAWPKFDRALKLDPGRKLTYEYKANWEWSRGRPAQAAATFNQMERAVEGTRASAQRCLVYFAGILLPIERAEPMLREALRRQIGTSGGHEWCFGTPETLIVRLSMAHRLDEVRGLMAQYQDQDIWLWAGSKSIPMLALADGDGDAELRVLQELAGADTVAAYMGPDPPFDPFEFWIVPNIAHALINKGQVEEGRQVAGRAADAILAGFSSASGGVLQTLAVAGRIEEALDRVERIDVGEFCAQGAYLLEPGGAIQELADQPRWQAFLRRCRTRWLEEVGKFDRMVASGEIVMPVPVPGPEKESPGQVGSDSE